MSGLENVGVIILAAGSSSRLGQPKQLVEYAGKSLLQRMIDEANKMKFGVRLVVSGGNSEIIFRKIKLHQFERVENQNWLEGIGSSIKVGTERALEINPGLEHLLILLSDQPYVSTDVIRSLCNAQLATRTGITASRYGSVVGVPAILSKSYFQDLLALHGDQGAKKIIQQAETNVHLIDFPNGEIDIDTPADLQKLNDELNKMLK